MDVNGLIVSNKNLKYCLDVKQTNGIIQIKGELGRNYYKAMELWLIPRNDKTNEIFVRGISPASSFVFNVSLKKLISSIVPSDKGQVFNWFVKIRVPMKYLSKKRQKTKSYDVLIENEKEYATYLIRLGKFQQTDIKDLDFYTNHQTTIINYITVDGNLSFITQEEPKAPQKVDYKIVKTTNQGFHICGELRTGNSKLNRVQIIAKARKSTDELTIVDSKVLWMMEKTRANYGLSFYQFNVVADMDSELISKFMDGEIYDLFITYQAHDSRELKYIKIAYQENNDSSILDFQIKNYKHGLFVHPYFTFKQKNLAILVTKFSIIKYLFINRIIRWAKHIQYLTRNKDIWLIGERIDKAQDTGYAFFKYIRTEHPRKKAYYIIKRNSKDIENVKKYGNVIYHKSFRHIWITICAKKIITSHHHEFIYPLNASQFKRKINVKRYYLGHGIKAMKNVVANYGKYASGFHTDFMIASSDREKEIIINDYGYKPKEVLVTGLPRFDTLFQNDIKSKRQILIIPTWRNWLLSKQNFLKSDFYEYYMTLLNDQTLQSLLKEYDLTVVYCMHTNMLKYSTYFDYPNVNVIHQGEANVQKLIKESILMITDYSSVAFDYAFLDKPVIFYQFDYERFVGKDKVHINYEKDLPGEIVYDNASLVGLVKKYAENDFPIRDLYKNRANNFIKFKDQHASKRIYQAINGHTSSNRIL